ncbi:MAG: Gfo/Idh/MocA family oxidoreductase [Bryobacteraceae bacterium]
MAPNVSRRHFFFGPLLAGAVPAAGFGSVTSLKALGYKPFNEKLNIAAVGAGGRGATDIRGCAGENIVALCDVDSARAAATFERYPKAARYKDFRVMLEKEHNNIDAVIVATPDHMHATIALAAMQRGKGVYVEKPLTRTPWEARLLTDAAAKYKVATQMGNQGFSHESNRVAAEIVWSGEIGDVREVHASTGAPSWPQGVQSVPTETKVPDTLDWDLWLGGAAMRPYVAGSGAEYEKENKFYAPFNWRGFFDFGTGPLGDWGIHVFGPVHLALQLTSPVSVEVIKQEGKSQWTFPTRSVLRYDFPKRGNLPPVSLYWYDAGRDETPDSYRPKGMEGEVLLPSPNNLTAKGRGREENPSRRPGSTRRDPPKTGVLTGNGAVFVGEKGIMTTVARGEGVQLLPAERWKNYELPAPLLTRSPGHYQDWIRACKGGEAACSNFSVAGPFAEWVTLGAIAYRVEGKLEWDASRQRFTNNDAANKYLKPVFRKGWELKL